MIKNEVYDLDCLSLEARKTLRSFVWDCNRDGVQLALFSTEYPGLAGNDQSVDEYESFVAHALDVLIPEMSDRGVIVQNIKYKRIGGWVDMRLFDLRFLYHDRGWDPIEIFSWVKPNPPPSGDLSRFDIDGYELCFAYAKRDDVRPGPNHKFRPVFKAYAKKTVDKAKSGKLRSPSVRGNIAEKDGGSSLLSKKGARVSNVIVASSSSGKRPRVEGGVFPLALASRFIQQYTDPGDIVADICAGSGTTIVAARERGRSGIGFDIRPERVAIANDWIRKTPLGIL